jgi:5'-nucleotidase
MHILLTNDDSHRSPLLEIAIRYLSQLGTLDIVVPLREQSWTAKSMTRFNPLHVHEVELFGRKAFAVDGTPADCINVGIYNLCSQTPELVVSGINAGFNKGLGFVLSSGTVGAALEANIAGIPAIALSQAFDTATRNRYIDQYMIEPETIALFERQTNAILDRLVSTLFSSRNKKSVLATPITWNVNLPFELTDRALLRNSSLGCARYGRTFVEQCGSEGSGFRTFVHDKLPEIADVSCGTDSFVLSDGCASLCPINMWSLSGIHYRKVTKAVARAVDQAIKTEETRLLV